MKIIFLLMLLVTFWLLYSVKMCHRSLETSIMLMSEKIYKTWCFAKETISVSMERKCEYNIYQNLTSYIADLKKIGVAKYIRFAKNHLVGQDVEEFRFEIYGINDEYKKDMVTLEQLLTIKLRDIYLEKLGKQIPAIYLIYLREGEFAFWIAKNKHGDRLIEERMEFDANRERPNIDHKLLDVLDIHKLTLGLDLEILETCGMKKPIILDIWKKPSGLIVGASGSGKSYFVTILLNHILCLYGDAVVIYYCDFKSSEDTEYLKPYCRYYAGEKSGQGLVEYYEEYQTVKNGKRDGKLRLLFFDEWAGFQLWETQKSKKQAEIYKSMLQEILLMGRSLYCGAWIILQRPDSSWISGRENFHNICCFLSGGVSSELAKMISLEEDVLEKIKQRDFFRTGEAVFKSDGEKTKFMIAGEIPNVAVYKKVILDALARTDGGAGSAESATSPL